MPAPTPTPEPEPEPEPITIVAMGDMLPHDSVNQNADQGDGEWDYGQFFTGVQPVIDEADAVFCNQEVPSAGVELGISGYPTFNAPVEFARDLREVVGCDLINLGTNHTADKGAEGIDGTVVAWEDLEPLAVTGANRDAEEQRTVPVAEVEGVRVALVSFAEYSNAPTDDVSMNFMDNDDLVEELMATATESADAVLVSAHWGTEDTHEENEAQRAFAQRLADLGADVVIGHGPHVLQPATWLDGADGGRTLVWYSIGNMLSTQLTLDQRTGVIAGFELERRGEEEGERAEVQVVNPTAVLTYMHYDWSADEEEAGALNARRDLALTPLASADELFERARFDVSADEQLERMTDVLGDDVTVIAE